jgi:hypothetical protein
MKKISPLLGLPVLPVVVWPDGPEPTDGRHWKTATLVAWAAGGNDRIAHRRHC